MANPISRSNMVILFTVFYMSNMLREVRGINSRPTYGMVLQTPSTCQTLKDTTGYYYFSIASLKCLPCAQSVKIQRSSDDGSFIQTLPLTNYT